LTSKHYSGTVLRTMLMIRLQRVGRRNHAEFRVVVTEKARAAKSSKIKELVGNYNPHTNSFTVDEDRVKYWMSVGAQASPTLHNLLVSNGVIKGEKINVLPKKSPVVKEDLPAQAGKEEEKATKEVTEEEKQEEAVKEAAEVAKDEEPEEEAVKEAPEEKSEEVTEESK
jgi:small subunit ribosomal protein S16